MSSCSAAFPMRIGGLDTMVPTWPTCAASSGSSTTTDAPSALALRPHSSRARGFTSTASTESPGWRNATVQAIGPYPHPTSTTGPSLSSGSSISSSLVPGSTRPGEKTPASVASSRERSGRSNRTDPGREAEVGSVEK